MANEHSKAAAGKDRAEPVRLSDLPAFATGGRRRCYVDPRDANRCIKVARTEEWLVAKLGGPTWLPKRWRRAYDNNADELKELGRLQRKLGDASMARHFPRVYGMVDTDLGPGLVLDLVRDADGRISRSLREHLAEGGRLEDFRAAYDEFGRFLIEHKIVTRDLLDHNLTVRREAAGGLRFFLIDGFGDSAALPVAALLPGGTRRRIDKKLRRSWGRFEALAEKLADPERAATAFKWRNGFLHHR